MEIEAFKRLVKEQGCGVRIEPDTPEALAAGNSAVIVYRLDRPMEDGGMTSLARVQRMTPQDVARFVENLGKVPMARNPVDPEDTVFKMSVWAVMEAQDLTTEEKLVMVGYYLYQQSNPWPDRIARAASIPPERMGHILYDLIRKGWMVESGEEYRGGGNEH